MVKCPGRAVKFPTGPSNSHLYGGNVKSNALVLPGGGGLIAVGFDSYIIFSTRYREPYFLWVVAGYSYTGSYLEGRVGRVTTAKNGKTRLDKMNAASLFI